MQVALALEVPLAVAVTKADIAEADNLDAVASELRCHSCHASASLHDAVLYRSTLILPQPFGNFTQASVGHME